MKFKSFIAITIFVSMIGLSLFIVKSDLGNVGRKATFQKRVMELDPDFFWEEPEDISWRKNLFDPNLPSQSYQVLDSSDLARNFLYINSMTDGLGRSYQIQWLPGEKEYFIVIDTSWDMCCESSNINIFEIDSNNQWIQIYGVAFPSLSWNDFLSNVPEEIVEIFSNPETQMKWDISTETLAISVNMDSILEQLELGNEGMRMEIEKKYGKLKSEKELLLKWEDGQFKKIN